jgi:hypothetical protein
MYSWSTSKEENVCEHYLVAQRKPMFPIIPGRFEVYLASFFSTRRYPCQCFFAILIDADVLGHKPVEN